MTVISLGSGPSTQTPARSDPDPPDRGSPRLRLVPGLLHPRVLERSGRCAKVALVAAGALLLGGDRVVVDVTVGDGCHLNLEDIGGTVAYSSRAVRSHFDVRIRLGRDATLIWAALPFVVAAEAHVLRSTTIELGAGAHLALRETLVLGRSGETGGRIQNRTEARDHAGGALLLERLDLDGADPAPGILGPHRVMDSVIVLGRRPPPGSTGATSGSPAVTVLALEEPGAIARQLASAAHLCDLEDVWCSWIAPMRSCVAEEVGS